MAATFGATDQGGVKRRAVIEKGQLNGHSGLWQSAAPQTRSCLTGKAWPARGNPACGPGALALRCEIAPGPLARPASKHPFAVSAK